jgi:hypothetical protein
MLRAINKPDSPLRRAAAAMPLLAWVALGTFVLALAAAAASSTGRYVADARFEIYWGTGRYLRSQLSLWTASAIWAAPTRTSARWSACSSGRSA